MVLEERPRPDREPALTHLASMIDPRIPELVAWIDSMPTAWEQAVTMHALCLAFPFLKICEDWKERVAAIEDAMHLREREHQDLIMEAARVSGRLKVELAG